MDNNELKRKLIQDATGANVAATPTERIVFPTEWIDLPSKGLMYPEDSPFRSGKVEMKYMTTKEEDILTSSALIKKGVALDMYIESLVVDPAVKAALPHMLLGDYDALIIASRILGYGPEYNFRVTCPICGHSPKDGMTLDLRTLKDRVLDYDIFDKNTGVFAITLPVSKANIQVKLFTRKDENAFKTEIDALKQLNLAIAPENSTLLKHSIVSVNGKTDTETIRTFVDTLRGPDSLFLKRNLLQNKVGIDTSFTYTCSNDECGHESELTMPTDVSFFWPGA